MVTKDILNSHPVSHLRAEISKTNIKGYSKMKKGEIIEIMLKTPDKFKHIKMYEKGKPVTKSVSKPQKSVSKPQKSVSKPATKSVSKPDVEADIKRLQNFNIPTVKFYSDMKQTKKERLGDLKQRLKTLTQLVTTLKKVDKSKMDSKVKERLAYTLELVPDYKEDIKKRKKDIDKM